MAKLTEAQLFYLQTRASTLSVEQLAKDTGLTPRVVRSRLKKLVVNTPADNEKKVEPTFGPNDQGITVITAAQATASDAFNASQSAELANKAFAEAYKNSIAKIK